MLLIGVFQSALKRSAWSLSSLSATLNQVKTELQHNLQFLENPHPNPAARPETPLKHLRPPTPDWNFQFQRGSDGCAGVDKCLAGKILHHCVLSLVVLPKQPKLALAQSLDEQI